jgi:hypothetical protein
MVKKKKKKRDEKKMRSRRKESNPKPLELKGTILITTSPQKIKIKIK